MSYNLPFLSDLIKKSYKPACSYCQEVIDKIHERKGKQLKSYDSLIVIEPDYNCSGIITHYHIIDYENPEQLKEKIDFMIWKYNEAKRTRKEEGL